MRVGALRFLAVCGGALAPAVLGGQAPVVDDTTAARPDSAQVDSARVASCEGQLVRRVDVAPQRPEFRGHMARWRRVARALGLHHATTKPAIVRRFVSLDPGRPCTDFRRAESERILRAQPYLASALVRTVPHDSGGVVVEVETIDEVPAIIGGHLHRGQLAEVSLGNENAFGLALRVEGRVERRANYRDGYGASFTHHQLFGKPYELTLEGFRRPVGEEWRIEAGHAFLTDLQRIAWHAGVSGRHDYLPLRRMEHEETTLPVHFRRFDVGGVLRFGPPGRLWLVGGVVTREHAIPAAAAVVVTDSGFVLPPPDGSALRYDEYRVTRLNAVTGLRALRFRTARGLQSLAGEEDLATGLQLGLVAGRGLRALGGDEDLMIAGDLFAGLGDGWSYVGVRLEGEARRGLGARQWDGVVGAGRAAWFVREAPGWTLVMSAEATGGWRSRLPVGLSLADRDGVRGFRHDDAAVGARRLVTRVEQRVRLGAIRFADVGIAAFGDAGRLWAGDLPYGRSTPTSTSAGLSLLAAVPRGAQRLWRLDVATPLRGGERRLQVRVRSEDRTRGFYEEPEKVARARSASGLARIFSWP